MKKTILSFAMAIFTLATNANENLIISVPEEWSKEELSFPLQFAPSIKLKGIEEVHFAPGMFKPGASDYFNYAFLWHVDNKHTFSQAEYEILLREYYKGLYLAVSKASDEVKEHNSKDFSFELQTSQHGHNLFQGKWLDAFNNDNPIELNIEIKSSYCAAQNKSNFLFLITSKGKASAQRQLQNLQLPNC